MRLIVVAALAAVLVPVEIATGHVGTTSPARLGFAATPRALTVPPATPRADCRPGGLPEPGIQGRVPAFDGPGEDEGYRCNITQLGQSGSTGGFKVLRYIDRSGRECAFYDTTLLFPTNASSLSGELTGVAVLDMSDPAKPVRTASLQTPAMQSPHESLVVSAERGLLVAVAGNLSFAPGIVDVYDVSKDCRVPELLSSTPVGILGHESGMSPDGRTFFATSISTDMTTAIDLTNPRLPVPIGSYNYNTHGMSVSDDGRRGYLAAGDGLIIVDLSEIQDRKPKPQVREISRLTWPTMTIPQNVFPVTIGGKPYLVEIDEFSKDEAGAGVAAHGPRVGAGRIIDITDETKPVVVSDLRLAVHQPEHRAALARDPGAQFPAQGYAGHYCFVPRRQEPGIVACSMIVSGLRLFDIRDPRKPKELGYYVAPRSTISATGAQGIDENANWAMSQPAFAPERGEVWYSDGSSGFRSLQVDPEVWPFRSADAAGSSAGACTEAGGLRRITARASGRGLRLGFSRRVRHKVRVEVFRVSQGRRVLRERRVARFSPSNGAVRWNGRERRGGGPGVYFVRYTMLDGRRVVDRRRLVVQRDSRGRFRVRPDYTQRDRCGLIAKAKLRRAAFGGRTGTPLRLAYRIARTGTVAVTISRDGRVVRRIAPRRRPGGRLTRLTIGAKGLRRGEYVVKVVASSGEEQAATTLTARRL